MVHEASKIHNAVDWNNQILAYPGHHVLQSWEWGEIKQQFGWHMLPSVWRNAEGIEYSAGMLLQRRLSLARFETPLNIIYCPRGPLLDWSREDQREMILAALEKKAKDLGVISLKIDPEIILGTGIPGETGCTDDTTGTAVQQRLLERNWQYSPAQVQFRNTVMIDLQGSEEEWLARMKQKTRYNIRLAQRKGIVIREGTENDLLRLYRMYLETSLRDGFVIRSEAYYLTLWRKFLRDDLSRILLAEFDGELLSGLILFHYGSKAWYFYGMSNQQHGEKMPNYLIQWEAMRLAKRLGCTLYDMWGAPEVFDKSDHMWGVYRFKSGFGGQVVRTPGAWDFAPNKGIYLLFSRILPALLGLMRNRRLTQAQHEAG